MMKKGDVSWSKNPYQTIIWEGIYKGVDKGLNECETLRPKQSASNTTNAHEYPLFELGCEETVNLFRNDIQISVWYVS